MGHVQGALSDTDLFDEVIDELVEVMLESIEDEEDFRDLTIAVVEEGKTFAAGDQERCAGHWKRLYGEALKKIKQACRKVGIG